MSKKEVENIVWSMLIIVAILSGFVILSSSAQLFLPLNKAIIFIDVLFIFISFFAARPIKRKVAGEIDKSNIIIFSISIIYSLIIISNFIISNFEDKSFRNYSTALSSLNFYTLILSTCFLTPIMEELLFRGVIFGRLRKCNINFPISMLISSTVFSILHGTITHFVPTFILGMFFCALYEYTGTLIYGMLAHAAYNFSTLFLSRFLVIDSILIVIFSFTLIIFVFILIFCKKAVYKSYSL